jgi:hypothetical protein
VFERVKRTRQGDFSVRLTGAERELLADLRDRLRDLLTAGDEASDPALKRLFPPATMDDERANERFREVVHDDLLERRLANLDVLEQTASADRVTEEELLAWLAAINDFRLVLGVRLNVTEETTGAEYRDDEERAGMFVAYRFLTLLEEQVVAALSTA